MICAACGKAPSNTTVRLPKGWHRLPVSLQDGDGGPCCPPCWAQRYVLRAVTVPVVKPLGSNWSELRASLDDAWSHCSALSNWAVSRLFAADTPRAPEHDRLPAMPRVYLYPEAAERFPELPTQTVAAILHLVQGKYRQRRHDVLWTGAAALPTMRYPQPFVCPNQGWRPVYAAAGKSGGGDKLPAVEVTLLRGVRLTLQLRGGRDFSRQLRDFALLASGVAIKGELALLRHRVGGNENRNGTIDRDSGDQQARFRVMVKMVGWFPRHAAAARAGTLFVRTDADSFLLAVDTSGERLWRLNADHVRRWTAEHRRRLDRWSEDQKAEERPIASFQSRREAAVRLYRRRIESFTKEAAAQLAAYARRLRVAVVQFDDSDRRYFERFHWSGFRERLRMKLDELGMTLELVSASEATRHTTMSPAEQVSQCDDDRND